MSIADYGFAIWETFYVTVLSTAFALVLGLPLGVLLVAGDKDGVLPLPGWLMHILNIVIMSRRFFTFCAGDPLGKFLVVGYFLAYRPGRVYGKYFRLVVCLDSENELWCAGK